MTNPEHADENQPEAIGVVAVEDAPAPAEAEAVAVIEAPSANGDGAGIGGLVPRIEWTTSQRFPRTAPVEVLYYGASIRLTLHLEGTCLGGRLALDQRHALLGEPLRQAIIDEFASKTELRAIRERVLLLSAELREAEQTVALQQANIRNELAELAGRREGLLRDAAPGLTLALAGIDDDIAAATARLGRLDHALDEVKEMHTEARARLKRAIDESASWNAGHVGASLRSLRDSTLEAFCQVAGPLLSTLCLLDTSARALASEASIIGCANLGKLLHELSTPAAIEQPPAPNADSVPAEAVAPAPPAEPEAPPVVAIAEAVPSTPEPPAPKVSEGSGKFPEPVPEDSRDAIGEAVPEVAPAMPPVVEPAPEPLAKPAALPAPLPRPRREPSDDTGPAAGPMF